jgi:glycosyltransferase involved in cell wall biosynthesis
LRVLCRTENGGKGAAVLEGLRAAASARFTHVLVMDADGQHPASSIERFMTLSSCRPEAMVLGVPLFDETAPRLRVIGRKVSNTLARVESLGSVRDSLFGFRVYPIAPLLRAMEAGRFMRRFDFDVEAAIRLCWDGVPVINVPAPVRYFSAGEGGVSHFRYARDNLLLAGMHARLLLGFLRRLPSLLARRLRSFRR